MLHRSPRRSEREAAANAASRGHRRHEPDAIQAVVDRHPHAGERASRSRSSALTSDSVRKPCAIVVLNGDSAAARAAIDVNPLTIAGRVGELVDARPA